VCGQLKVTAIERRHENVFVPSWSHRRGSRASQAVEGIGNVTGTTIILVGAACPPIDCVEV
jgi:hypothetical protein